MLRSLLAVALPCAVPAPARAEICIADWYAGKHYSWLTASGTRFDQNAMTAAHKSGLFGFRVTVTRGERSVAVTITVRARPLHRSRLLRRVRQAEDR